MNALVTKLAVKIADECARSDIEINCAESGGSAADGWIYDLDRINPECLVSCEDRAFLDDAVRYLELRGLLERVDSRGRVRFTKQAVAA